MPALREELLQELLCDVERPVRYIGREWNSVVRDDASIDARVLLAYPDQYEIGMSHLGFRILYSLLNRKPGVAAERAFAPWPDLEAALRARGVPLYSLETKRPLREFDLLGFSLQYEMTLTNVLLMLDLAGVPLLAQDRRDGDPLVLAGGPVALAPEPFADFFDLVVMGDGEELFPEIVDRFRELRDGGASRATIVEELGRIPGVYAPRFYDLETEPSTGQRVVAGSATHPFPVKRRILMDLGRHPFPRDIIVPFCEVVHSRVAVEIMRGCNVGCRFCQAGYIYRPERIRTPDQIVASAIESAERTGFDEVSLTSLNTGEYPQIENVISRLMDRFETTTTAVSLPSLRASSLTGGLLDEIDRVRKMGLTIAPEGGTQRMRDVINKNITDADITSAAEAAYSHGWDLIKLYFMIGQPTEREEDVRGIADTALRVLSIGQKHARRRAKVNLGVSSFIPKAFTPFQWAPMERVESLQGKHALIRGVLGRSAVKFGRAEIDQSLVESALSRGDRRIARVILRAYRDGARFDGWTEHFNLGRWRRAFADEGLDLLEEAHRAFPLDARLPWDHVDIGVRKSYLLEEWKKAITETTVSICSGSDCHGCGSFVKECLAGNASFGREFPNRRARKPEPDAPERPAHEWRALHEKAGWLRFLSHHDVQRTFRLAFRRAGLEMAHTEGFHPMPKIGFGPPLPVGFASRGEVVDLSILREMEADELLDRLNGQLPEELRFQGAMRRTPDMPRLSRFNAASYEVNLLPQDVEGRDPEAAVAAFLAATSWPWRRIRKAGDKDIDLRPGILALSIEGLVVRAVVRVVGESNARPDELMSVLLERSVPRSRVTRVRLLVDDGGSVQDPLASLVGLRAPVLGAA